jgi:acetamidase/formamidase
MPVSGQYATTGVGQTLHEASKTAVRNIIQWMVATKGLTHCEAYIIASVAGDLQIIEAVNMPNYVVAMTIPLGIFGPSR